jgi:hypothetical protein
LECWGEAGSACSVPWWSVADMVRRSGLFPALKSIGFVVPSHLGCGFSVGDLGFSCREDEFSGEHAPAAHGGLWEAEPGPQHRR